MFILQTAMRTRREKLPKAIPEPTAGATAVSHSVCYPGVLGVDDGILAEREKKVILIG